MGHSEVRLPYSQPWYKPQLDEVLERAVPFLVLFGPEELARGVVKVKDMQRRDETEVPPAGLVEFLLARGCRAVPVHDQSFLAALQAPASSTGDSVAALSS